jgi:hypothetical protein
LRLESFLAVCKKTNRYLHKKWHRSVTANETGFISSLFWAVIGNKQSSAANQPAGGTTYNAAKIWNVAIPDFLDYARWPYGFHTLV